MGYWNDAVKRHFPKAESISEDWDARSVSFEMVNSGGSLTLEIDNGLRDGLVSTFGSASLSIMARPDTRYSRDADYDHMTGVILKITIKEVAFPERP